MQPGSRAAEKANGGGTGEKRETDWMVQVNHCHVSLEDEAIKENGEKNVERRGN